MLRVILLLIVTSLCLSTAAQLSANFNMSPKTGCSAPLTVFFTDQSITPDTWSWNFGDGSTSNAQNPIHPYTSPGVYVVTLVISDTMIGGNSTFKDTVKISNISALIGSPSSYFGCAPVSANFTDASSSNFAITNWSWDFGEGNTSNSQNPSHVYSTSGLYTVSLTVTDALGCTDTDINTNYVQAIGPDVDFSADELTSCINNTISFTDLTTIGAPIIGWTWDFGDGATSSIQSPTHTYTSTGDFTVSLTVDDLDGCSRTLTKTNYINIREVTANPIVDSPESCAGANDGQATAAASGGIAPYVYTWSNSATTATISGVASATYTISVVDQNGLGCASSVESITIPITDNINPTITCPSPASINTDAGICTSSANFGTPVTADNCTTPIVTNNAPANLPIGMTSVTWTVADVAGNTATCTQDVTVVDNENPVITCPAAVTINVDAGNCTSTANFGTAVATDNCTALTISNNAPASLPIGNTTVTWTAIDGASNSSTCPQIITVVDNQFPVITCPADITINTDPGQCTATASIGTATATDNCAATVTNNAPAAFPVGITTVTWTATDGAGNSTTCDQIVTVTDIENPVITCPANITIDTDAGLCTSSSSIGTATATDNCAVTVTNNAPTTFPIGITLVTWTATDASNNVSTCTQTITVSDNEVPIITCPVDITIDTDLGQCTSTASIGTATASDNCTVTVTNDAPSSFPIGNTTVIWTATDAAGNTTTCSQIVTVQDNENPSISCPADITINSDAGQCTSSTSIGIATASDNCGAPVITNDAPANLPIGNTTVTWTATDAAENIATCTQIVTVTDTEIPTITCPPDLTINTDAGQCTSTASIGIATATDNCSFVITNNAPSIFPIGNTIVTWTVTDAAGNIATCNQSVTVEDNENPTITCISSFETCDSVITFSDPIFNDNCTGSNLQLVSGIASSNLFPIGVTSNTYEVTDGSGNTASCSFDITRYAMPTINIGEDVTINAGFVHELEVITTNGATFDWYPSYGINNPTIASPNANPEVTTTYTLTVTSSNGCVLTDEITITVNPQIEVNNFMSPNNDGDNDTWEIKGNYLLDDCTIQIYDSWGNLIQESLGYQNDWDGTKEGTNLPEGTYFYIINCNDDQPISGSITLIR